jgi:hypothetical protein
MPDKEDMREAWASRGKDIDSDCLCNTCEIADTCEYAFDLYNFDDSCLGMK